MRRKNEKRNRMLLCVVLFSFVMGITHVSFAQVNEQDSLALVKLYNSTDGANWTNKSNWLTDPVPSWHGITTEGDRVTKVHLSGNNLVGTVPEEIAQLVNLTHLDLSNNQISGEIPSQIGNLKNLEALSLFRNQLTGNLPDGIYSLTSLIYLYLYVNQLEGEISPDIAKLTNLKRLFLYANRFTGEIPKEIGDLSNLTELSLWGNQLSGEIPSTFTNLVNLIELNMENNQLGGPIPEDIGNLTKLTRLHLGNNKFKGDLPTSMQSMVNLEEMYLYANYFTGLPDLSSIATLWSLHIQDNKFTFKDIEPHIGISFFTYSPQDSVGRKQKIAAAPGTSPEISVHVGGEHNIYQWFKDGSPIAGAERSTFTINGITVSDVGDYTCEITNSLATALTLFSRPIHVYIDIYDLKRDSLALVALYDSTEGENWTDNKNWLSGPVSEWYGITVKDNRVIEVDLSQNNLVGTIPEEIGELTGLTGLKLSRNKLGRDIPHTIGNLLNLKELFLDNNQLAGEIPAEIARLTQLTGLILIQNKLTGKILDYIPNFKELTACALEYNTFSGTIPASIGTLTQLVRFSIEYNQFEGEIPPEIGNCSNLKLLFIGANKFTGGIPPEIGKLKNLEYLSFWRNQLSGEVPAEIGNLVNLVGLNFINNQFIGAIPSEILNLTNLQEFYLSYNSLSGLPDLSSLSTLAKLYIENNKFTFEDIEPNMSIDNFVYAPQDSVGAKQDTTLALGDDYTMTVDVGGSSNKYQWTKDGIDILAAIDNSYTIIAADSTHRGEYCCKITNPIAPELTLFSRPVNITIEGAADIAQANTPIPQHYALYPNYPNPFNPVTTIAFDMPVAGVVRIKVYNLNGQLVKTLIDRKVNPDTYSVQFDGTDHHGKTLSSGIYLYILSTDDFECVRKLSFLK